MTKIGVGVGEEFPVGEEPKGDAPEGEETGRGHRGDRREAWCRFRQHMRAKWHARRHGFGHRHGGDGAEALAEFHHHHVHRLVIGGLALIGLAALISTLHSRR